MKKLEKTNKFIDKIEELRQEGLGINIRELCILNEKIFILYIPQITNRERISTDIIRPILKYYNEQSITIEKLANSIIYVDDISIDNDEETIIEYILDGNSVIIISNDDKYIAANTVKIEKRSPEEPKIENSLRGPKDAFTENMYTNLSLIRYRIKDPKLRIDHLNIGKRTKTDIAVVYINDIANPKYVNEVKKRLKNIDIDGVLESGYIQKFILNNAFDLFPQAGIIERSDMACAKILEGKICIIVEGSNLVLSMPKTFIEFLDSGDDNYDSLYLGMLSKSIRILSIIISLTLSSLYVATVGFHSDILPEQYILALATSRALVPFNAVLEAILMEVISEILREASIRLPQQIGSAIGIVGTIVIGQAAVAAGLVSPLMVIIVSLGTMCSFVAPDYTIMNPIRVLKFFMIFITGIFGLFGFVMGFTVIVINIISLNSFGVAYLAPLAPFNFKDLRNFIFSDITLAKKRPDFLNTQDKTRQ